MRCPVCRADNAEGPVCRRCRADLSLLFALEGQRAGRMGQALRDAGAGNWRAALEQAAAAHRLRRGADSARLRAACHLMLREFAEAWQWYRTALRLS